MKIENITDEHLGKMCKNFLLPLFKDEITEDELKKSSVATATCLFLIEHIILNFDDSFDIKMKDLDSNDVAAVKTELDFNDVYNLKNENLGSWKITIERKI